MTKHAYLPTVVTTCKGSIFVSEVIDKVTKMIGINLKQATTKHAQTIVVLKWAPATIKYSLKMASVEYRKQWHKYSPNEILNYNMTYQSSIDCELRRVFHGRVPHNILNHKLGLRFNPNVTTTKEFAEELLHRTKILLDKTIENIMQSYIIYERYYDQKAEDSLLKERLPLHTSAKSQPSRVKNTIS